MTYNSLKFLLFLIIFLIVYYIIPKKVQRISILFGNILFYIFADNYMHIPFVFVTLIITYIVSLNISKIFISLDQKLASISDLAEKAKIREQEKSKARKIMLLGVIISILVLLILKYSNFFIQSINKVFKTLNIVQFPTFKLIIPLGISFYTLMAISYVLDVYWRRIEAEKSFLNYATYFTYFPHIVQGPIDRYKEFNEQLNSGIKLSYKNITYGAQLAIFGLFKKLVIADRINLFVNTVYDKWNSYGAVILLIATFLFCIQIYADFSGCMDIVCGVSEMMGIKLKQNFNHPYFSKTVSEFWRRWHISLMEWFKDYVYLPVYKSKLVKKLKSWGKEKGYNKFENDIQSIIPTLVVWVLTGFWHGAEWKYVAWGLYYAVIMVFGIIFENNYSKINNLLHIKTDCFSWRLFQMIRTFVICMVGRVFFKAASLHAALGIFKNIFTKIKLGQITSIFKLGLDKADFVLLIVAIFVLWVIDILQEKMCIRDELAKQNIIFRWIIIYAGIFAVIIFGIYGPGYNASDFIYRGF